MTLIVTLAAGGCAMGIFLFLNRNNGMEQGEGISEIARIEEEDIPARWTDTEQAEEGLQGEAAKEALKEQEEDEEA